METDIKNPDFMSLQDIKRAVDKIRLHDLDQLILQQMHQEISAEQEVLRKEATELHGKLKCDLNEGHGSLLSEYKKQIRQVTVQHKNLEEDKNKVFDAWQQRILEDRLITVLGSRMCVKTLEFFIIGLIFFVIILLIYDLSSPGLSDDTRLTFFILDTAACIIFLIEFFFRHHYADSKKWFWSRHWIDFVTSIPIPDLQALRIGRLARVARVARLMRVVRILRVLRVVFFFWRGMDKLSDVLDVKMMKRSLLLVSLFLIVGALVIYYAEGTQDGVNSFAKSIWWSFTTVVTGGYGDIHNPTTTTGQLLTVLLVIAGMVVVGIFTATLTSVLVGDGSEKIELMQKALNIQLEAMMQKISQIETHVAPDSAQENKE
ncbi:ion transporter [candidate division CSSED10-310 bacterium]|uniref:Ion transporter n=1 Tax=candidate division CSSED10-310 bacterium TaxID=2855610 RepID=A0ABV6Z429_UNCC1